MKISEAERQQRLREKRRQKRLRQQKRLRHAVTASVLSLVTLVAAFALYSGQDDTAKTTIDLDIVQTGIIASASKHEVVEVVTPEPVHVENNVAEQPAVQAMEISVAEVPEATAVNAVPATRLPVYKKGETNEKVICITVDDCYQLANLKTIASLLNDCGGKATFFPIGEAMQQEGMGEYLRKAIQAGCEIGNHTYSHARIFRMSETEMAQEIWKQNQTLNGIIGANYKEQLFRCMGGDGQTDERTSNYLDQLGYAGFAYWSLSGSDADIDWIKSSLAPGMVYLFHATDSDTEKLKTFIPYAASQGYTLITMGEMFGLEQETVTALDMTETMPEPRAYTDDYTTAKKGEYTYKTLRMQEKLVELGLLELDEAPTGYYGDMTAKAIERFQIINGLEATGEADEQTQKLLLEQQGT